MTSDVERVAALLADVMRDVETTTSFCWSARVGTYDEWVAEDPLAHMPHDGTMVTVYIDGDHFLLSFAVELALSNAEISTGLASAIQDEVIDELQGAWPLCPRHDHPLDATVLHGLAVWTCPHDGSFVAAIGGLDAG